MRQPRLWPMFYMWQWFEADPQKHCIALQGFLDAGYGFWDAVTPRAAKRDNIWDLGKLPRPTYQKANRLVAKHIMTRWSGYAWNRYSPIDAW